MYRAPFHIRFSLNIFVAAFLLVQAVSTFESSFQEDGCTLEDNTFRDELEACQKEFGPQNRPTTPGASTMLTSIWKSLAMLIFNTFYYQLDWMSYFVPHETRHRDAILVHNDNLKVYLNSPILIDDLRNITRVFRDFDRNQFAFRSHRSFMTTPQECHEKFTAVYNIATRVAAQFPDFVAEGWEIWSDRMGSTVVHNDANYLINAGGQTALQLWIPLFLQKTSGSNGALQVFLPKLNGLMYPPMNHFVDAKGNIHSPSYTGWMGGHMARAGSILLFNIACAHHKPYSFTQGLRISLTMRLLPRKKDACTIKTHRSHWDAVKKHLLDEHFQYIGFLEKNPYFWSNEFADGYLTFDNDTKVTKLNPVLIDEDLRVYWNRLASLEFDT